MALAIFDLDKTLITGDSDFLWGEFMSENEMVDRENYQKRNADFFEQYTLGKLNIGEYLEFCLEPLSRFSYDELNNFHRSFLEEKIRPIISNDAIKQVEKHRDQGDILLVLTATNRFITSPIVAEFGIENLLATEIEFIGERYTGKVLGKPCFQEGKIEHLKRWIGNRNISLDESYFYSDSHNDLPTLELVDYPNVVNPDNKLREIALKRDWPIHNWT